VGDETKPDPGKEQKSGLPQIQVLHVVIAVAVIVLAVIFIAKFGFNMDLISPSSGEMAVVKRPVVTPVRTLQGSELATYGITVPTTSPPGDKPVTSITPVVEQVAGHPGMYKVGLAGAAVTTTTITTTTTSPSPKTTIDTSSDVNNCNVIGHKCELHVPNTVDECWQGQCVFSCLPDYRYCDNLWEGCVAMHNNPAHCGGCNRKCNPGETCEGVTCIPPTCGPGLIACKGKCVNILSDASNCGGCGKDCHMDGATVECTMGKCILKTCNYDPAYKDYSHLVKCHPTDTTCTNLESDEHNCGECGKVCSSSEPYCYDNWCHSQPELPDYSQILPPPP
jgi:hypothetical protein